MRTSRYLQEIVFVKMKTQIRVYLTSVLILFFLKTNFAQSPNWSWGKNGGTVSNDYSNATCTDANGNVYITGTFQGSSIIFGNDTLRNNATGSLAIFIAKYDANGNVLWARSGGGSNDDYSYGICTDINDNVFIEGYSASPSITFDTITINNSGYQQVFIIKYNSMGNVQWAKNGKTSNSYGLGWGICSDVAGNVYLYGSVELNNIIFDNDTLGKGAFIVKYDGGGNIIWAKNIAIGLVANNREQSMCIDLIGNIYITGAIDYQAIFGTDTLSTTWLSVFIAKYDSSGNLVWLTNTGDQAIGNAISADPNGNVYLTGYFGNSIAFGNDTLTGLTFSNSTIFVAKYDSSGNALWGRTPGGSIYDSGQSICTDATGNAFVTGYFISSFLNFGGHTVINSFTGNNDAFIVAYDGNGNALWAKGIGDQGNEYGMGICANTMGDIYLTGYFESYTLNFGNNIVTNNGSADVFLAKLSALNGLNVPISNTDNSVLLIYPNPTTNSFAIENILTNNRLLLRIINSVGEIVYTEMLFGKNEYKVDVNFSPGFYFINIFDGEKSFVRKLIVE
jgi:hypothetical protein